MKIWNDIKGVFKNNFKHLENQIKSCSGKVPQIAVA